MRALLKNFLRKPRPDFHDISNVTIVTSPSSRRSRRISNVMSPSSRRLPNISELLPRIDKLVDHLDEHLDIVHKSMNVFINMKGVHLTTTERDMVLSKMASVHIREWNIIIDQTVDRINGQKQNIPWKRNNPTFPSGNHPIEDDNRIVSNLLRLVSTSLDEVNITIKDIDKAANSYYRVIEDLESLPDNLKVPLKKLIVKIVSILHVKMKPITFDDWSKGILAKKSRLSPIGESPITTIGSGKRRSRRTVTKTRPL